MAVGEKPEWEGCYRRKKECGRGTSVAQWLEFFDGVRASQGFFVTTTLSKPQLDGSKNFPCNIYSVNQSITIYVSKISHVMSWLICYGEKRLKSSFASGFWVLFWVELWQYPIKYSMQWKLSCALTVQLTVSDNIQTQEDSRYFMVDLLQQFLVVGSGLRSRCLEWYDM